MNDEITESDFFYIKPPLLAKGKHLAEFFLQYCSILKTGPVGLESREEKNRRQQSRDTVKKYDQCKLV